MAAAAILKIAILAITHRLIVQFQQKFCMMKQNGMSTRARWQKLPIFKIQHGRRPPFWKLLNRHISVKNRPILMKFGALHQILNPVTVMWPKIEIFWIQDGGECDRHLENRFFGHNSSIDCPILAKFCMPTKAGGHKLQIFKIQDGGRQDGRHFENRYIAISLWKIVRF